MKEKADLTRRKEYRCLHMDAESAQSEENINRVANNLHNIYDYFSSFMRLCNERGEDMRTGFLSARGCLEIHPFPDANDSLLLLAGLLYLRSIPGTGFPKDLKVSEGFEKSVQLALIEEMSRILDEVRPEFKADAATYDA